MSDHGLIMREHSVLCSNPVFQCGSSNMRFYWLQKKVVNQSICHMFGWVPYVCGFRYYLMTVLSPWVRGNYEYILQVL